MIPDSCSRVLWNISSSLSIKSQEELTRPVNNVFLLSVCDKKVGFPEILRGTEKKIRLGDRNLRLRSVFWSG